MNQKNNQNATPTLDAASGALKVGRYRHYKGGEYDVISVAEHSETREKLVVYRCLRDGHSWWVRPLDMFCENVVIEGNTLPRFEYMGEASKDE